MVRNKVRWGVLGAALIAVQKVIPAMQHGEWSEISAIASRLASSDCTTWSWASIYCSAGPAAALGGLEQVGYRRITKSIHAIPPRSERDHFTSRVRPYRF